MSRPKVEIIRRERHSGYERYEGAVNGKKVAFDVTRQEMEKLSERHQEAFIKRSLVSVSNLDDGKDGGSEHRQ